MTAERITERDVLDALSRRYGAVAPGNGFRYARAEHVKSAAGFHHRRVCDYMALDLWPGGTGPTLHGHEVKVSRSDWLTELRDPDKAEAFRPSCDYWWLVVSDASIVKSAELPDGWGLMVLSGPNPATRTVRVRRAAPRNLDVLPLSRDLQACLARSITKTTVRLATGGTDPATEATRRSLHLPRPTRHVPEWPEGELEQHDPRPSCSCGYNGTPDECAASRTDRW